MEHLGFGTFHMTPDYGFPSSFPYITKHTVSELVERVRAVPLDIEIVAVNDGQ